MAANPVPKLTAEEYIRYSALTGLSTEFHDGEVHPVEAQTAIHDLIVTNIASELRSAFRKLSCVRVFANTNLYIPKYPPYRPDVSLACDPKYFDEQLSAGLMNAHLIVEVLSESTQDFDRGRKRQAYQTLESMTDYLIVSQWEPLVEHWKRTGGSSWSVQERKINDSVFLSLNLPASNPVEIALSEIYYGLPFPEKP